MSILRGNEHIMTFKLAAKTFWPSLADALEFFKKDVKLKKFQDFAGTAQFIENIDRIFGIFHARPPFSKGLKCPIKLPNIVETENVNTAISDYLWQATYT